MSVTIKDIAREAGVSYASVSRALSGSRGVSVKTAQRILAVAKKLNYLPNGIARNDVIALGALQYAQETGIRVPQELCIAGFDGISYASLAQIRLTTIRQDRQRMGETATHLLLDEIESNSEPAVQKVLLTPTLLAQATTGDMRLDGAR